jgi:hypothetical protein
LFGLSFDKLRMIGVTVSMDHPPMILKSDSVHPEPFDKLRTGLSKGYWLRLMASRIYNPPQLFSTEAKDVQDSR